MARLEPARLAEALEHAAPLPRGAGDCFAGYAVLGVPFEDGDVLALRRFPASSAGPGYTSVWHRAPDGRWTFYADVAPTHGCSRYFGPAIAETIVAPIRLEWTSDRRLAVAVDGGRLLVWSLCLAPTMGTRMVNLALARIRPGWWASERLLGLAGPVAGIVLGAGRLRFSGFVPSGARFHAMPAAVWAVAASRGRVLGRSLGAMAPLPRQASLGDVWIPRRGLFAAVQTRMLTATNSETGIANQEARGRFRDARLP
ncbi:MAG: hypothetical protein AB7O67_16280 [Vicinamibacterales bacterium]